MALDKSQLESALKNAFATAQKDKTPQAQDNLCKALAKAVVDCIQSGEIVIKVSQDFSNIKTSNGGTLTNPQDQINPIKLKMT